MAAALVRADAAPVEAIPAVGDHWLRVLSPDVLELGAILPVPEGKSDTARWSFADKLPDRNAFRVTVDGTEKEGAVQAVGFRRRPRYAPLAEWDLRVEAALYLQLAFPLKEGAAVRVSMDESLLPATGAKFSAQVSPTRRSEVLHVSQVGYQIGGPKTARAGYYLGSLGELNLSQVSGFYLRDVATGEVVFRAPAKRAIDKEFTYQTPPFQEVLVLDFSAFDQPGNYTVGIDGIGESYPFPLSDGYYACLARTYALGLYHQRCGCSVGLPYSRFQHAPCHTHAAKVPEPDDNQIWKLIKGIYDGNNEEQTAPALDNAAAALYPFRRKGEIDVNGGHHDAGDYSKYVVNSAQLIHALTLAADAFPGVNIIDNLGLPESGNGIPDAIDIAACEAAFLAKMQDSDGGFYFLVYPRERSYETDVTPDKGDLQTVFPKTTSSTAAAAAALCQIASSPTFRKHYPMEADRYLRQAEIGWRFIAQAQKTHGEKGAYQTISHYGDRFMDRDEIAWLATELFLATGDEKYHQFILRHFKPGAPETVHWGWLRMQDGYGAAARSYATAVRSGRLKESMLHAGHLRACNTAIGEWADQLATYTEGSAYGVAFPFESKHHRVAGWHFAGADTFNLVAAIGKDGRMTPKYQAAVEANFAYETGANAVNVCHLSGLGYKRQFEIVHQWGLNDREQLPLSGIPVGSLQSGFRWNHRYETHQTELTWPSDDSDDAPYPFYHRWADSYNLSTEFTIVEQARGLAAALALMGQSRLRSQPWKSVEATIIEGTSGYTLSLPAGSGLRLTDAMIVWEAEGTLSIHTGPELPATSHRPAWISAEAQWPDGRRIFATLDYR
ncbi:MAG: glycoside hydrolase family 9 protein [Verrucomicrobiales bacterium]